MTVYLVGAGPGDPGLLTIRAWQLIESADVIVHDRLVSEGVLALVPEGVRCINVGKKPGVHRISQEGINELLVELGRKGEKVVRLKGGDPFVFGRGGEEAAALGAAGVAYEVVPGISSAIAAPTAAGIPVTSRGLALSFTVVTGHEDPTTGVVVDWEALARTKSTLVILMGAARIGTIADRLMGGGLAPATPVAFVLRATASDQEVIRTTLEAVGEQKVATPTTVVIGEAAGLDLRWMGEDLLP